jgi:tripartite-type tricarboxylate transporter receptor subunit TctC
MKVTAVSKCLQSGRLSAPRRDALSSLAGLAVAAVSPGAIAQGAAWPSARPIRLVIPSGAGGGADILGRRLAEGLARALGTTIVSDNKPGAAGLIAASEVARAPADGHTLLLSFTGATVTQKLLVTKPIVDPMGFEPIGRIGGGGGNPIIVHPDVPVRNIAELVSYARSKPGLSYASWGIGTGGHLFMEYIKKQTGMELTHVPYKSSAQIPPDVVSGVMPIATIDAASPLTFIRSGRIRAIAAMSQERLPQLPDVPTIAEQGIPIAAQTWYGVFAPLGTPSAIIDRLNRELNAWLILPETVQFFVERQNIPAPIPTTPSEFRKVLQSDLVAWKTLLDAAGIKPE